MTDKNEDRFARVMDENSRKSLAKVVTRLFEVWEIDATAQCRLLGMTADEEGLTALDAMRDGAALPADTAMVERVGNLFGIHKCLRILYQGEQPEQIPSIVYTWMTQTHKQFPPTPLDYILEGEIDALFHVRDYLELMRIRSSGS